MKRSAGIIVSAIIAILGSVALSGFGAIAAIVGIAIRWNPALLPQQQGIPQPPIPVSIVLFMESILFVALGTFGIIAAIGLLRLKNWARMSFIVFSGILCFFCIVGVFGTLLVMLMMPHIAPADPNVPPSFLTAVFAFYLVLELAVGALAVWWLIYFTRRRMKEQFLSPAEAAMPLRGPLSVTIIAWLLVVGGSLSSLVPPVFSPDCPFRRCLSRLGGTDCVYGFRYGRFAGRCRHAAVATQSTFSCPDVLRFLGSQHDLLFRDSGGALPNERGLPGAGATGPGASVPADGDLLSFRHGDRAFGIRDTAVASDYPAQGVS